ncbi:hypothetical protein FZC35_01515 [Candidatus Cytomitobacter indipagum]|uniref:Uncharacterized protein n=1 Tax=Candidatus Cytomitobacter indipagum TaxID=2601575 RepID=A0A5C0UE61_9PROT|nr:hypothetical protein [Candidatus Cytomitobacter indipagum]QEK38049.1 hypothetical protein FZC35_01515 [Candidatus Cytomitobacter indipagum]
MSTNYPNKWNSILQGEMPRFRDFIEPIFIDEVFVDGKYVQKVTKMEQIWCHMAPLNLHQKQTGVIQNFFGIVCNLDTKHFSMAAWNDKYVKVNSFLQPINNRYGYLFAKEIRSQSIFATDNVHIQEIDSKVQEKNDLDTNASYHSTDIEEGDNDESTLVQTDSANYQN